MTGELCSNSQGIGESSSGASKGGKWWRSQDTEITEPVISIVGISGVGLGEALADIATGHHGICLAGGKIASQSSIIEASINKEVVSNRPRYLGAGYAYNNQDGVGGETKKKKVAVVKVCGLWRPTRQMSETAASDMN